MGNFTEGSSPGQASLGAHDSSSKNPSSPTAESRMHELDTQDSRASSSMTPGNDEGATDSSAPSSSGSYIDSTQKTLNVANKQEMNTSNTLAEDSSLSDSKNAQSTSQGSVNTNDTQIEEEIDPAKSGSSLSRPLTHVSLSEDTQAKIKELSSTDLRKSALEAIQDATLEEISGHLHENYPNAAYTYGEHLAIASYWIQNKSDIKLLMHDLPVRSEPDIASKLNIVERVFRKPELAPSIETVATFLDLVERHIFSYEESLKSYSPETLNSIREYLKEVDLLEVIPWTEPEILKFIDLQRDSAPLSDIINYFILRNESSCLWLIHSFKPVPADQLTIPIDVLDQILFLYSLRLTNEDVRDIISACCSATVSSRDLSSITRACKANWDLDHDDKLLKQLSKGSCDKIYQKSPIATYVRYWKLVIQPSTLISPPKKLLDSTRECLKQNEPIPDSFPSDIYLNTLSFCANTCLTKSFCQIYLPAISISTIIADLNLRKLRSQPQFLPEELGFIQDCVRDNSKEGYVCDQLFYHDSTTVNNTFHEMNSRAGRRTTFGSSLGKLIYEAKWLSSMGTGSRRKRRGADVNTELSELERQAQNAPAPVKKARVLTEEEIKLREERKLLKQQEQIKAKNEQAEKQRRAKAIRLARQSDPNYKPKQAGKILFEILEDAAYFQSIVGDGKMVKDGAKRQRKQASFFIPEFKDRSQIKRFQKRLEAQRAQEVANTSMKKAVKKLQKEIPKKRSKAKKANTENSSVGDEAEESDDSEQDETNFEEKLNKAIDDTVLEDPDEVEHVSPFDPTDIMHDTKLPTNARKLFVDEIYSPNPSVPEITFKDDQSGSTSSLMIDASSDVPFTNRMAEEIIVTHHKNYRNYSASFPPAIIRDEEGRMKINECNKVYIRFLLYPQYTESFILADPKSNELDPIFEIQKIFQIHYALYFSHSENLRKVISDNFCTAIEDAVNQDDFEKFMLVIDSWNTLMIELCPNAPELDPNMDINAGLKKHLPNCQQESRHHDLLELFINEIMSCESPAVEEPAQSNANGATFQKTLYSGSQTIHTVPTPPTEDERDHFGSENDALDKTSQYKKEPHDSSMLFEQIPTNGVSGTNEQNKSQQEQHSTGGDNDSTRTENEAKLNDTEHGRDKPSFADFGNFKNYTPGPAGESTTSCDSVEKSMRKPQNYSFKFFENMKGMTHVSRFCMQQLLLRAYTRIVSPDSRKLRSYKAFTAEVYGELLPSFVSEVLTKVDLLPTHRFYDLGSGVGNTTFQAALEFGAKYSGGCELMPHASNLTEKQANFLNKQMAVLGLRKLPLDFALSQSFVDNERVRKEVTECDILIVNNYLFDFTLNVQVGKLLWGLKPGTKIISLRNFIPPRYKVSLENTVFDYLSVEKHEMSDFLSVSWTANKVPYYISTVEETVRPEYM